MNRSEAEKIVREAARTEAGIAGSARSGESKADYRERIRTALTVLDAPDPRDALLAEARKIIKSLLGCLLPGRFPTNEMLARALLAKLPKDDDSNGPR